MFDSTYVQTMIVRRSLVTLYQTDFSHFIWNQDTKLKSICNLQFGKRVSRSVLRFFAEVWNVEW
jgi:hypothetical protein